MTASQKLNELKSAAEMGYVSAFEYDNRFLPLATPSTILKLIAVVASLEAMIADKEDGPLFHDDEHLEGSVYRTAKNVLKELEE